MCSAEGRHRFEFFCDMGARPSIQEMWQKEHGEAVLDVAQLRARNIGAWETLFDRMYPRMLAYAQRRMDSADDARDAVSETFTRMVQSLERLDATNVSPEAWCFGILHHVVVDQQRTTYRRRRPLPVEPSATTPEPTDGMLLDIDHRGVRAAFARLAPRDRDVLELRVLAELTADEVAEVLSMRPGAVRMAQSRALERLRSHFEAEVDQ
jgi:RNA polymerase sigma-70 factor (ECF subfamily)